MAPALKKFLITSGLVALVVGFGFVITQGRRAETQQVQPSAAATTAAPAAPAQTTAVTAQSAATESPTSVSPSAPAAAAAPANATVQAARKLVARLPAGMSAASASSTLGSLDPDVAPYRITFAPTGAGISEIIFSDFWKTADDRRAAKLARDERDPSKLPPESARFVLAGSYKFGEYMLPVLAARQISVDGTEVNLFANVWAETAPGRFVTEVADADGGAILRIERAFVPPADSRKYELFLAQRITNLTAAPVKVRLVQYGPGDLPQDGVNPRGSSIDIRRFHFGYLFSATRDPSQSFVTAHGQLLDHGTVSSQIKKGNASLWPNPASTEGKFSLVWAGVTDRYFTLAVHAPFAPPGTTSKALSSVAEVQVVTNNEPAPNEVLLTSLWTPVEEIKPGATGSFDLGVYAGPLNPRILEHAEPYRALNMGELVFYSMGGCCSWCTFAWLADGLLWFLSFIHDNLFFDWGLAIIALVIVVRLILHRWQKKSQISMQRFSRAMTAMKPELDALQKKFKDDPTRMQQEQMRLFREKGVSPAGCLGGVVPMFAQMPIWMALYAVLYFAFDLRQAPAFYGVFQQFGGWAFLGDLSAQDNFIRFATPIDLYFFKLSSINLLPVLMGIVFYIQQQYMAPPITPGMSEDQVRQQKIMKWMMVVMFPLMTYIAPSGLTLYILTSTCVGIVEGRIIKKQIESMDLTAKPEPGKKGALAKLYESMLERAAQQQAQGGRGKTRGKGR